MKYINRCACELCSLLYIRQLSFSVCVTEYLRGIRCMSGTNTCSVYMNIHK